MIATARVQKRTETPTLDRGNLYIKISPNEKLCYLAYNLGYLFKDTSSVMLISNPAIIYLH